MLAETRNAQNVHNLLRTLLTRRRFNGEKTLKRYFATCLVPSPRKMLIIEHNVQGNCF